MRDAMDGKTAALEAELGQIQAQLRIAEQDGAEIAALAEQTITELRLEIEKIKSKLDNQDKNMEIVFRYLDELITTKESAKSRKRIGYKPDELQEE